MNTPPKNIRNNFTKKYKTILDTAIQVSKILPQRYPVYTKNTSLQKSSFFVVGSGRNGSTLLSAMLNQHPEIMLPPEQWCLYLSIIKFRLLNYLNWNDLVKIVVGEFSNKEKTQGWDINFDEFYPIANRLEGKERNLRKLIEEIYKYYGEQKGIEFTTWGDKTPLNTVYLDYMLPVFSDSKYIFLLRDGRDVISSMLRTREKDVEFGIWKWKNSIAKYKQLKKYIQKRNLLLVYYENLLNKPEKELTKIVKFLDYNYEDQMLNFQKSSNQLGIEGLSHHDNLKKSLLKNRIGIWKERLSEDEKEYVHSSIEKELKEFNYI